MRRSIAAALCAIALSWAGAAPAGDPDVPERYVKVDEVKARLDLGQMVRFVDVRPREQYDLLHIRGALSIPLEEVPRRLGEVSRQDFTVVY
jgi:rhodanese-related sulfurtransferase